jgi:hypothetical protein
MSVTVKIDSVRDVRITLNGRMIVSGRDERGVDIDILFNSADAPHFAPQALCCAAIEASSDQRPLANTIIPGCHLPVVGWRTGRSQVNGEPILEIDVAGGAILRFQFPASTAQDCGKALLTGGVAASPPAGSRPN